MNKWIQCFLWLLVAGIAQAQFNSVLWKITGNGLKDPSYLFGTMHTSDKRVIDMGDSAMRYFDDTKAYAMELDPKKSMDLSVMGKLMMGQGYSLKKMIPAREYALLDSLVKERVGLGLKYFDNVAPVFVMTILEVDGMGLEEQEGKNSEVLDLYFYRKAKKKKKTIIGIETVQEQLDALNSISYEEQADMLVKEINAYSEKPGGEHDVVRFYLQQNLDSLATLETDSTMPEKFYKALVTDRNQRMAARIPAFMQKQPVFIAVGALHLTGELGVITLLRKQGYTVEAVK